MHPTLPGVQHSSVTWPLLCGQPSGSYKREGLKAQVLGLGGQRAGAGKCSSVTDGTSEDNYGTEARTGKGDQPVRVTVLPRPVLERTE